MIKNFLQVRNFFFIRDLNLMTSRRTNWCWASEEDPDMSLSVLSVMRRVMAVGRSDGSHILRAICETMWEESKNCCEIHMLFYDDGAMRLATCLVSLISWALAAAWQRPDRLQLPKPIITTCCELLHQPLSPRPRRCWPLTSNNLLSTVAPQIGKVLLEGWAAK